jgi:hypothetical protein
MTDEYYETVDARGQQGRDGDVLPPHGDHLILAAQYGSCPARLVPNGIWPDSKSGSNGITQACRPRRRRIPWQQILDPQL